MNDLAARMQNLDRLLNEAESTADPAAQAVIQEIVRGLLDLHRTALQRLLEIAGPSALEAAAQDDLVSPVLLLHNLHPLDVETRVRNALKKVEPYTASHGGHVELLSITDDGVVSLRMEGSCHGCPSSRVTLETAIEQDVYAAAPEVTSIVVEGLAAEEKPPAPRRPDSSRSAPWRSTATPWPTRPLHNAYWRNLMFRIRKQPPLPIHVPGTNKGEELVHQHGREPGRSKNRRFYRDAHDSTGLDSDERQPIDPRMPQMPPA